MQLSGATSVAVLKQRFIFLLYSAKFNTHRRQRQTLSEKIATIDANVLNENKDSIVNTLLFGKPNSQNSFDKAMLNASIEFALSPERFNNPLF